MEHNRTMTNKEKESLVLAKLAAQIMDEKKAEDVRVLDLRKVHGAPAEYFVIATGNVPSHVSALSDAVYETVKKATGMAPHKIEGYNNAEWTTSMWWCISSRKTSVHSSASTNYGATGKRFRSGVNG